MLLILKSLAPSKMRETGIFKVQNQSMKGFQQGNAESRDNGVVVQPLFDDGSVQFIFTEKNYNLSARLRSPRSIESFSPCTKPFRKKEEGVSVISQTWQPAGINGDEDRPPAGQHFAFLIEDLAHVHMPPPSHAHLA